MSALFGRYLRWLAAVLLTSDRTVSRLEVVKESPHFPTHCSVKTYVVVRLDFQNVMLGCNASCEHQLNMLQAEAKSAETGFQQEGLVPFAIPRCISIALVSGVIGSSSP